MVVNDAVGAVRSIVMAVDAVVAEVGPVMPALSVTEFARTRGW